jgi:ABC-type transport system involved in cytochrome c biogenesis permease subunit
VSNISLVLHACALAAYSGAWVAAMLAARRPAWRRPAAAGAVCGLGVQLTLFLLRWRASGHTPVTGLFESQHFLAIWIVAHALALLARYRAWGLFAASLGLAAAALAGASFGPMAVKPLTPSLDTPLFFLHVAASFAAYGLFGSSALIALLRLIGGARAPAAARAILDESVYLGWILFTWAMIAGSIWAYLAWGSYWTWNSKGIWSYLLWFYYAGVIHVRTRPAWQGRRLDLLALAGFAAVLFTYLGLGLLLKSNHPLL